MQQNPFQDTLQIGELQSALVFQMSNPLVTYQYILPQITTACVHRAVVGTRCT